MGTSATVNRGLKMIAEGFLDEMSVEKLAAKLGMGSRHLRRLFIEHLGASPIAIATTRRVHFAKLLIENTNLTMTKIAYGAGFSSIRRFNSAMKKSFDRSPSDIRQKKRCQSPVRNGAISLRLPFRSPYDWSSLSLFLKDRATPGVEVVTANSYRRTIERHGVTGTIELQPVLNKNELFLNVDFPDSKEILHIVERVRNLFDLSADPVQIAECLNDDRKFRPRLQRFPGLRVPGAWDGFELSVRAILGQQVSVKGATTLAGRLAKTFGRPITIHGDEELTRIFPSPEAIVEADIKSIGLPQKRAHAIRELAKKVAAGDLCYEYVTNIEEFREKLLALPGIGPWTANYIAMRAIRDPDAFPAEDLVLRKTLSRNGNPLTAKQVFHYSKRWQPWRAYAAMYLWRTSGDMNS